MMLNDYQRLTKRFPGKETLIMGGGEGEGSDEN